MTYGIKIVLEDYRDLYANKPEFAFRVERAFNHTSYKIGDTLSEEQVKELIAKGWTIEIIKRRK